MKEPRKRTSSTERKIGRQKERSNSWKDWSASFQSNEGRTKMFKIAKQMRKEWKHIVGSKYVREENDIFKVKEEEVMEMWRRYFRIC